MPRLALTPPRVAGRTFPRVLASFGAAEISLVPAIAGNPVGRRAPAISAAPQNPLPAPISS